MFSFGMNKETMEKIYKLNEIKKLEQEKKQKTQEEKRLREMEKLKKYYQKNPPVSFSGMMAYGHIICELNKQKL